jgi:glycosyltransferase involved in cell wall biosynthesis
MSSDSQSRVVLVTNGFTPNRVPLWNALNQVCKLTVVLLAPTEKRRQWELSLEQVEADVRIVGSKQLYFPSLDWGLNLAFSSVIKVLDEIKPDAVITGGFESPGYWAALRWAQKCHVPVVLWMGSTLMSSRTLGNPVVGMIKRRFITGCDSYYAYGRCAGEYLQHFGARADRIVTGINHTNVEHFESCERIGSYESCALLYVGQLIPRKGVSELFDALARVTDLRWTLMVAGSGELRSELVSKAERNGFADRLSWMSYVQQKDLSHVYRKADLLLMPSLNEVWGLVINEALMSGVYVLGSNRAAASLELIQSGVNGQIVEPEPAALERAIREAIARAPFERSRIRETISCVTPQTEAAKILRAVELACE